MSLFIIANWKMNGDFLTFSLFTKELSNRLVNLVNIEDKVEIILCPPFIALSASTNCSSNIKFGGQNCCYAASGKYTGEISASMLYNSGCSYVILGHSERRNMFYESDADVKLKAECAIESGLIPIVCVGETLIDRKDGMLKDALLSQCSKSFPRNGKFIIAYEPVWAIGSNVIPSIDVIVEALDIIRSYDSVSNIIYGGAVNHTNVHDIININRLSGVLVGSASLSVDSFFNVICNAINVRQN
ncbi:triose-phosphate isomerase [Ehrlichia ruminantium]|uniref:Triosephosphate isomerase n=1 Tax=Ehrlichia ruminantium TaxID=779 RepID=A0AAE6QD47_EHRRU|nr:triosephosphate isomerase [Ehrlichia ruminantium]QGR02473.1 triose-phosphate isomerase [Ehrlichia ruminantium]QGR03395.1 triose-phosphate isomerase [Ehrlichia ruminantium]QGR04321.1 triose-phosphate isomerase [Ehrlichia ruminantium]